MSVKEINIDRLTNSEDFRMAVEEAPEKAGTCCEVVLENFLFCALGSNSSSIRMAKIGIGIEVGRITPIEAVLGEIVKEVINKIPSIASNSTIDWLKKQCQKSVEFSLRGYKDSLLFSPRSRRFGEPRVLQRYIAEIFKFDDILSILEEENKIREGLGLELLK